MRRLDKYFNITILFLFICFVLSLWFLSSEAYAQTNTVSSSNNTVSSTVTSDRTVNSAHAPAAIANNSDVCSFAASVAIQTQVLGLASGGQFTDEFCQKVKMAKILYSFNLRTASVKLLCDYDNDVFLAMWHSGTYCPIYDPETGTAVIGEEARKLWLIKRPELGDPIVAEKQPAKKEESINEEDVVVGGIGISAILLLLLL